MARIKREPPQWPQWLYGPNGEHQVFAGPGDVPWGWGKTPSQVFSNKAGGSHDKEQLITDLLAKGIEPHPAWGIAHMKKVLDDGSPSR